MMTFKEIDERIGHYEEELEWCAEQIQIIDQNLKSKSNDVQIALLEVYKLKIEFFSFVTASYIDLLCTYRSIRRSKSSWEKFFNTKIAYLIIYETINTYHKYKGEVYKTVNREDRDQYKQFFRMLNEELAEFKEKYDYDNVMAKIRNKSTAHYDKNFLDYYASYELLNDPKSKDIVREFLYFINPLHYFTFGFIKGELDEFLFANAWFS